MRAVIEHICTDRPRQGYGRVLVAAALVRAPPTAYRWSTTRIADDPVTRAFWSGIAWSGTLGQPDYCIDMDLAARRIPDL
jgi:hypothetical protein